MQSPNTSKDIQINLTLNEYNYILSLLAKQPWIEVNPLINKFGSFGSKNQQKDDSTSLEVEQENN